MGSVLMAARDFYRTIKGDASQTMRSDGEVQNEDLLLSRLMKLQQVELWRLHWFLNQGLHQDIPPIPPQWLLPADASNTAKTMIKCYQGEGALMVLDAALMKMGQSNLAHHTIKLLSPPLSPPLTPPLTPKLDYVIIQRRKLISRMQCLDTLLDALQDHMILNTADREAINVYGLSKDKKRALVDKVLRKGDEVQEVFSKVLSESQPFLLQELESSLITGKNPSGPSLISEMLECLVSDELRCFQWLITDHMAHQSDPPIAKVQMQHADRPTTQKLLEKYYGPKRAESVVKSILLKTVPAISVCLHVEAETLKSSDSWVERTADTPVIEITPDTSEDGSMFRLNCQEPGVFRCSLTGLLLEGQGYVVYETIPWDTNFLSSKGLSPAGPLFRFKLLEGGFHRLHLPHCLLHSDVGQPLLSVAHVTGDNMEFITPDQVTDSHVIVNISSFSCFGLVTSQTISRPIRGLVLVFSQPGHHSVFVLLLPRNVCLAQVRKEWKVRARAEYVEVIPDCELIPDQMYKLSGEPVEFIQPEISKFVNFRDYNNFLPSFEVRLAPDKWQVELQLCRHVTSLPLIGWLFGSSEVVWHNIVQLKAVDSALSTESPQSIPAVSGGDLGDTTQQLLSALNSLGSQELRTFQHFLSLQPDYIPVSRLEGADRTRTVDLMLQQYQIEGAKQITEKILRSMNYNQLADGLT